MSKRISIAIAVVTFIFGLVVGRLNVTAYYRRVTTQMEINSLTSEMAFTVVALKRVRAGNATNAIEYLEADLKRILISLNAFSVTEKARNENYPNAMQMAQEYERQFPNDIKPAGKQ